MIMLEQDIRDATSIMMKADKNHGKTEFDFRKLLWIDRERLGALGVSDERLITTNADVGFLCFN